LSKPSAETCADSSRQQRFIELYLALLDTVGMPSDEPFRAAVRAHLDFGTRVAVQNSHATTDDQLHPLRAVPAWSWPAER
jgi:hemoglobin